jgi:hypothetical protein
LGCLKRLPAACYKLLEEENFLLFHCPLDGERFRRKRTGWFFLEALANFQIPCYTFLSCKEYLKKGELYGN